MDLGLPPKPSRESLVAMCRDEPEKAADLILMLWEKVETIARKLGEQDAKIARLDAKLSKNSSNSSKPPSTDKSNPGGQPGHNGPTLKKSKSPNHIVQLPKPQRCTCRENLPPDGPWGEQARQVFDLPPEIKIEVTEYRAPSCKCPGCGRKNTADFPQEAASHVQYGMRIRAAAAYLHVYHLLPYERLTGIFGDLFGCRFRQAPCPDSSKTLRRTPPRSTKRYSEKSGTRPSCTTTKQDLTSWTKPRGFMSQAHRNTPTSR